MYYNTKSGVSLKTLVVTMLVMLCAVNGVAQNNIYKINDKIYPIYMRAFKNVTKQQGLLAADTVYREAVRLNDKKAQCLARAIPVLHYYRLGNEEKLWHAAAELKSLARKNGYLQYFYFAGINEVQLLLAQGKLMSAMMKARAMKDEAMADDNKYGIAMSMKLLGTIYFKNGNITRALESYLGVLDYFTKYVHGQDVSTIYSNISTCQSMLGRYDEAYDNIEKCLQNVKTPMIKTRALFDKCILLYELERPDEFYATYKEYLAMVAKYGLDKSDEAPKLRLCKALLEGNYAEAHKICDSLPNRLQRLNYRQKIYLRQNDYVKAYSGLAEFMRYSDSVNSLGMTASLSDMDVIMEQKRFKEQMQAMRLENAQLMLDAANRDLEDANMRNRLEAARVKNQQLELSNQKMKNRQISQKAAEERMMAEMQRREYKMYKVQVAVIVGGLIMFFLTLFVVRQRNMRKLKRKNAELDDARRHAEEADRLKSVFIQNISHELRTPLNAIVGFSQLLSDPDYLKNYDDRVATCKIIEQNSNMLTSLVNDILLLSRLESGNYEVSVMQIPCNNLCVSSVALMKPRVAEGVKLYYTTEVDDSYIIQTSKECVEKVLYNLIDNSIKNTVEGEIHLHCSTSEHPGCVTFSVADTGPGIPEGQEENIFERFLKLDDGDQSKGLGLSICRAIANCLGATIRLDRSYKGGARFEFVLPL